MHIISMYEKGEAEMVFGVVAGEIFLGEGKRERKKWTLSFVISSLPNNVR